METKSKLTKLSNLELAEFFNQMGIILHSGISPIEGLALILEDSKEASDKALFSKMIQSLEETGLFYEAVSSADVFPAYALSMIKLGEETGCLDEVTLSLSRHYTREANFSAMIRSSLLYPSIMLGMIAMVIIVLLTKVMPVFHQVFMQLGQEMTGFSAVLLNIGENLSRYSIVFIVLIVIAGVALIFGRKHLPFQKNIQKQIAACRFCEGMAIALKSGLTTENALTLVSNLVENEEYSEKIAKCTNLTMEGMSLSEAFHKSELLTGTYARMASIAEKTGNLDEVLAQIASDYEYMANNKITRIISAFEPTLVMVLSLIVGIILFSVMFPLLGIMTGL